MFLLTIVQHYMLWHYTTALSLYVRVWLNFWWFVMHFFSIRHLLGSLFAPFRRQTQDRGKTWDLEDFASYVIINLISRILGALIRLLIIGVGVLCLVTLTTVGVLGYAAWLVAPLLVFVLLASGIILLFS